MTFAVQIGRAFAAILFVGVLSTLTGCSSEMEAQAVPGSAKAAKLTKCVRPTDFMRRNHMELIKHQRDITVHQGVRATSDSLAACIACHVQYDAKGEPIPVNAEKQFCNGCHESLAVQPDCFGCHSTVPEGPAPSNLMHTWPEVFGPLSETVAEPVTEAVDPSVPMRDVSVLEKFTEATSHKAHVITGPALEVATPEAPIVKEPALEVATPEAPVVKEPAPEVVTPEAPVVEAPVAEVVAPEAPVVEEPAPEAPVVKEPAPEVVAPEAPVVEEPAPEVVAPEAPVVEEPAPEVVAPEAPVVEEPASVPTEQAEQEGGH